MSLSCYYLLKKNKANLYCKLAYLKYTFCMLLLKQQLSNLIHNCSCNVATWNTFTHPSAIICRMKELESV